MSKLNLNISILIIKTTFEIIVIIYFLVINDKHNITLLYYLIYFLLYKIMFSRNNYVIFKKIIFS